MIQLCPVCKGSGLVAKSVYCPWEGPKWGSVKPEKDDFLTCKACGGKGVHFSGPRGDVQADMRQKPEAQS